MLMNEFIRRALASALTLYMMAILLRWTAPYLELDLRKGFFRLLPRITDPLIKLMRRALPTMGPMDWAPIAALVAVWLARLILVGY